VVELKAGVAPQATAVHSIYDPGAQSGFEIGLMIFSHSDSGLSEVNRQSCIFLQICSLNKWKRKKLKKI